MSKVEKSGLGGPPGLAVSIVVNIELWREVRGRIPGNAGMIGERRLDGWCCQNGFSLTCVSAPASDAFLRMTG